MVEEQKPQQFHISDKFTSSITKQVHNFIWVKMFEIFLHFNLLFTNNSNECQLSPFYKIDNLDFTTYETTQNRKHVLKKKREKKAWWLTIIEQ